MDKNSPSKNRDYATKNYSHRVDEDISRVFEGIAITVILSVLCYVALYICFALT